MKNRFFLFLLLSFACQAQNHALTSAYEFPAAERQMMLENFQGIEKLNFSIKDDEALINKDYKITVKTYKNGKLFSEKLVIDTKDEGLPKTSKDFKFSILAQHNNDKEKIGFYFAQFSNTQTFEIDKKLKFKDNDFLLREVAGGTEKIEFEVGKEFQIALITPPNNNPSAGNLGYCEVSKGHIDVKSWYEKYKIPQFFIVYLSFE